jgi:hypothetical protein
MPDNFTCQGVALNGTELLYVHIHVAIQIDILGR